MYIYFTRHNYFKLNIMSQSDLIIRIAWGSTRGKLTFIELLFKLVVSDKLDLKVEVEMKRSEIQEEVLH